MIQKPKIVLFANTSWYLVNFRSNLIELLVGKGYCVEVIAPDTQYFDRLKKMGVNTHEIGMTRSGTNPLKELLVVYRLRKLLVKLGDCILLTYTPKCNLYSDLAAYTCKVDVINNISGLGGSAGDRQNGIWDSFIRSLYRVALHGASHVFFQNKDDYRYFTEARIAQGHNSKCLPGSGVDLAHFTPQAPAYKSSTIVFLLASRLLWDKGVGEYVAAAKKLKQKGIDCECWLLGFIDADNPSGVRLEDIDSWHAEGTVKYLGATDDVRPLIAESSCFVLPSNYREGVPRSVIEASAMGKPIITTDRPGCREVVDDGVTGFLCEAQDADDLYDKMSQIIALTEPERKAMGLRGREKVEREFDENIVLNSYVDVINAIERKRELGYEPVVTD